MRVGATLAGLVAIGAAFWWLYFSSPIALCLRPDRASWRAGDREECLFSASYWESRSRFREATREVKSASLYTLEVTDGLTMDVALVNEARCNESALVVTSGVHGVEGFAGAAVQLGLMKSLAASQTQQCFVVVHAVNPYGFAMLRRWNEDNVDLNRNALFTPAEWQQVLDRDPNIAGYLDMSDMFNPAEPPSLWSVAQALVVLARQGVRKMKRALVTGTYHCSRCLFYGGQKLSQSHVLLKDLLERKGIFESKRVFFVDIHTGLGPEGMDTWMVSGNNTAQALKKLVAKHRPQPAPYSIEGMDPSSSVPGGASDGYDLTRGDVCDGYGPLFRTSDKLLLTQEFGTIDGPQVFLALRAENQAFHFSEKDRDSHAARLVDVFNPQTLSFRKNVVSRGKALLELGMRFLQQE